MAKKEKLKIKVELDNKKALIVDVSGFIFLGDDQYYVEISAGSVKDDSGNAAAAYGFTFSTLDNIIIDVRENIGGNEAYAKQFASYLIRLQHSSHRQLKLHIFCIFSAHYRVWL